MPHLVFYNLAPTDFKGQGGESRVEVIEASVNRAISGIEELGLKDDDISYTFVKDESVDSENIPVVIIVELLFEKEGRTFKVRQRMAKVIGQAFIGTISGWREEVPEKIEVAVKRFNPEKDGFWSREVVKK